MGAFGDLIPHQSIKGKMIHKVMKPIMLNAMSYMEGAVEQIVEEKKANGFVNPSMKVLFEIFTDVIEADKDIRLPENQNDHIRNFYINLRNCSTVVLDEDTHYLCRAIYMWKRMYDRWPEVEQYLLKAEAVIESENFMARRGPDKDFKWKEIFPKLEENRLLRIQQLKEKAESLKSASAQSSSPSSQSSDTTTA